jgi:hypothetical protein
VTTPARTTPCPVCGRTVTVRKGGRLAHHGAQKQPCPASGLPLDTAAWRDCADCLAHAVAHPLDDQPRFLEVFHSRRHPSLALAQEA